MNLENLISTLQFACSAAITNHNGGTLGERAAILIAFDSKNNPSFWFSLDSAAPEIPEYFETASTIVGPDLANITDTIAGLGLTHEQETNRMALAILAHLGPMLYSAKPPHDHIYQLAKIIDGFTVAGIVAGIANAKKAPVEKMVFTVCKYPERN